MCRGSSGNNQRVTGVSGAITLENKGALLQVSFYNVIGDDSGVKTLGMLTHPLHQIWPSNTGMFAGPVINFGSCGKLSTRLQTGNQNRVQVGTGGIDRSGITSRAGTENN